MAGERSYVLGNDARELSRLAHQHRLWAGCAAEHWDSAGLRTGQTLVDLGCGPGYAARDLAELIGPSGHVIGIERSETYARHAEAWVSSTTRSTASFEVKLGDIDELDLEPESIDAIYARWVFTFLPNPSATLAKLRRWLRPAGKLLIQDYFNWEGLWWGPLNEGLPLLRKGVMKAYGDAGGHPSAGGELLSLLPDCGYAIERERPVLRAARPSDPLWQWPTEYFANFVPKLVEDGALSESEGATIRGEWAALSERPDAIFMSPPQVLITAAKAGHAS